MSQVLALKYRPKTFDGLIGQNSVTQTLTLALNQNRLSHAYLFSGLRGSGKTSTARIFSKALICENGPTATPCEECENCKMANENRHIDIIEMDAASSRKIDDIRELIEHTKYKPNSARFKIFIIDEVHMLTKEAFNALLKTLEEPPSYVKFILATTDPLKLPPTILSRTQHFRFKQIGEKDVINHLSHILNLEDVKYETAALKMLSRAGNGSLRDTLTLLDQAIIFSKSDITAPSIASMLGLLDPQELDLIFDTILSKDKEETIKIIKELESYECEVVLDEIIAYLKNAFFEGTGKFSTLLIERFFRILSEAKNLLYLNADNSFVLSLVFFKMIEATNIKTIDEIIENLENEKFRVEPGVKKLFDKPSNPLQTTTGKREEIQEPQKTKTYQSEFIKLISLLKDRNLDTGNCFEKSIKLIDFKDKILFLESSADESCKKILRHASSIIKHFVQETFGIDTTIKMQKSKPTNISKKEKQKPVENKELSISSQTEEENCGSCVAEHLTKDKGEIDANEILGNPFIKKATDLFEPKKIEIHPKI
ncbi:MAG: DNA polymerase III subunit gamma/tau [Sulfurospirillum sp.]